MKVYGTYFTGVKMLHVALLKGTMGMWDFYSRIHRLIQSYIYMSDLAKPVNKNIYELHENLVYPV